MSTQNQTFPDNPQIQVIKSGKTGLFTNYIFKAIPLAFDESLSYYECLCGLLDYLKNVIIPTVNNNADAVAELQTLYEELRTYVKNYFDNLDVQDEINNKLDKMVEDGTLQDILMNYTQTIRVYNTHQEMIEDITLVNNEKVKTLGYYEINDGGGAEYYINNDSTSTHYQENISSTNLFARLISNNINVKMFGAKGDDTTDDSNAILTSLNNFGYAYFIKGNYKFNINLTNDINYKFDGENDAIIKPYNSDIPIINILCNEITNYKIIKNLNLQLNGAEIGIKVALPSFVDNYYPQKVDIHNINAYVLDGFVGKVIELNYIRELNIYNIYVKRQRLTDAQRTGIGIYTISCMNLNIKNCSFGFLDKAISIINGTMSSEGIMIDNVEMFFNNYGVYAQSNSERAILNLRIQNCMIDQVQKDGIYIDGVTTSCILNNWLGVNVANSNAINLQATNRENYSTIIDDNTIWLANKNNAYCININRSNTYNIRNTTITNNTLFNYNLYAIYLENTLPISILKINNNHFETSSQNTSNRPLYYNAIPNNTLITNCSNNGAPMNNKDLLITQCFNIYNNRELNSDDITIGSTIQNTNDYPIYVILNATNTSENDGRIAIFQGNSPTTITEQYTQVIKAKTVAGFGQNVYIIIPPKKYYSITKTQQVNINNIYGIPIL